MGFLLGPYKIKGRVGGLVFSNTRNGNTVMERGGVVRSRVLKDPEFLMTRENSYEFGGASSLAAKFYNTLGIYSDLFKPHAWGAVQKEFVKVVQEDPDGTRGNRCIDLLNNGNVILDFDMGINPINNILRFPIDMGISEDRKQIYWSIPTYPEYRYSAPKHNKIYFKLIFTASVVPKMIQKDKSKYMHVGPTKDAVFYVTESEMIYLNNNIPAMDFIIELDNPPQPTDAILVCVGVAFYEMGAGSLSFIKNEGGFKLVNIG